METIIITLVFLSILVLLVALGVAFRLHRRERPRDRPGQGVEKGGESKDAEDRTDETQKRKRREPVHRGGRPRGIRKTERETPKTKRPQVRPEVVCWKKDRIWIVGIDVSEELEGLVLTQNDKPLKQDETNELRWPLDDARRVVRAAWSEGEMNIPLTQPGRNCLLFKMRKNWGQPGRLVKFTTSGFYLVVVPEEWGYDEEVSGPPPVTPESVHLDGYKAHFLYLRPDGHGDIWFATPSGQRVRVESGSPRFRFVGREIGDASDTMGPLFGEEPPRLQAENAQAWSGIGTIVVGEEGPGKNRLGTEFGPVVRVREQELPESLARRRGGWYFVRIYDKNDDLFESMDFRFMSGLKDIIIEKHGYLPGPEGHSSVAIHFHHEPGCKVELMNLDGRQEVTIETEKEETIATVPPVPTYDESSWIVRHDSAEVQVTILAERVWWGLGTTEALPTDWQDRPVTLSREDFVATSERAIWVRFPHSRWVKRVEVGFSPDKRRPFAVEVDRRELAIALREFCDAREIEDRGNVCELMMHLQPEGAQPDETVVAQVPADQPIPIQEQWVACGRKKTAVAYAVVRHGPGKFIVNNEPVRTYCQGSPRKAKCFLWRLLELEKVKQLTEELEIDVTVIGSQPRSSRQIRAVAHAAARSLWSYDPGLKGLLRQNGFGGVRVTRQWIRRSKSNELLRATDD